jgi:predicted transcriptional regulator
MDINLQNKKIELIQWLSTLNDQALIDKIMKLRKKEKIDWWNEISTAEKNAIEKGIQDANNGKLTSHSNVKKIYEKWL